MSHNQPQVIFLMGPTASGKTDLALSLYETLDCEVISVDSAMVYRGMDIGTAKPDADTLKQVPHHLIDICDPAESYSAERFRQDAIGIIDPIIKKNKTPLLVGGTGLYFRALEQGLAELPDASYRIRNELENEAKTKGWQAMHARLKQIDPDSATRINENDPQRIQRALEVYMLTGRTMTDLLEQGRKQPFPYPVKKILLFPEDRKELQTRIKTRFLRMLEQGLVDEVKRLYQRGDLSLSLPSMRLVGYRQVWRYLAGETDFETMKEHAIVATRQLAKRQMTWFRGETDAICIDSLGKGIIPKAIEWLDK